MTFNIEQLQKAQTALEVQIDLAKEVLKSEALVILSDSGITTPSEGQLQDVAFMIAERDGMDYEYTNRLLQSLISFKMEVGVEIVKAVS